MLAERGRSWICGTLREISDSVFDDTELKWKYKSFDRAVRRWLELHLQREYKNKGYHHLWLAVLMGHITADVSCFITSHTEGDGRYQLGNSW